MITIVYAALAGLAIVFGAEAVNRVHAKPGDWKAETAAANCDAFRLRPRIGASDNKCPAAKVTGIVEKK